MRLKGPFFLLTTAFLWGMGFVAQTSAARHVDPFTFNAVRNLAGALFLAGLVAWRKHAGYDRPPQKAHENDRAQGESAGYSSRTLWIASLACGTVIFAAASSRAGFLTTTYVVMVACMAFFLGKRPTPLVLFSIVLTMAGMYLLCVPDGLGSVYLGDWLILACTLVYSLHIILIDRFSHLDAVRLSALQLVVASALSAVFALIFEHPSIAAIAAAILPILYAGIVSNGIAYTLQIMGQQTTPPAAAAIIMTLEGVFAALGGWLLLSERLNSVEILGCALVFAAAIVAQTPELRRKDEALAA